MVRRSETYCPSLTLCLLSVKKLGMMVLNVKLKSTKRMYNELKTEVLRSSICSSNIYAGNLTLIFLCHTQH